MVMGKGKARSEEDGEGTSGVSKSSGSNCEEEGFLGFSHPMSQSSGLWTFLDSNHNLVAHMLNQPQNQAFLQNPMPNSNPVGPSGSLTRVRLSWTRGGSQVAVTGSWDNWATREWLQREGDDFHATKALPPGEYHYLFVVDGYLRCAPDSPWVFDASGSAYNVLDLQESESEFPEHLWEFETPASPPSSYNNEPLSEDDYSKLPPETPPQLQATFGNEASSSSSSFPLPQAQQLNHLYIQNHVEGRFIALGSTRRFNQKYVMMVLYKPLT